MKTILSPFALALCLVACGPAPSDTPDVAPDAAADAGAAPAPPPAAPTPPEQPSSDPALTPAGFGPHQVGQRIALVGPAPPVLADGSNPSCHMYRDPNLPGVWIMTDGEEVVRRVIMLAPSTLETAAGIGIGATEAAVRAAYPSARAEPRGGGTRPGALLYTAPADRPGLRFDIDAAGKVVEMSGGAPPFLRYGEGCA